MIGRCAEQSGPSAGRSEHLPCLELIHIVFALLFVILVFAAIFESSLS